MLLKTNKPPYQFLSDTHVVCVGENSLLNINSKKLNPVLY